MALDDQRVVVEEEKKESDILDDNDNNNYDDDDDDDDGWCIGVGLEDPSGGGSDNVSTNSSDQLLIDCLPPQLHPAVSLGMRRVSSTYFSLQGSGCSEADLYSLCSNPSMGDFAAYNNCNNGQPGEGSCSGNNATAATTTTTSAAPVDANSVLYHDIMLHVFTFLDAKSLAAFSETARRSNFECFYFLQLQLQRALLYQQPQEEDDRLAAIAGSWSISRLAALDRDEANASVQEYLDSNSTLKTMPLSHSLAYIRQVLRQHGFTTTTSNNNHQTSTAPLAKAAMLVTLVGAATLMSGNVEVVDSFGTELPNMIFKVGFVGSLMNAARRKWEEKTHDGHGDTHHNTIATTTTATQQQQPREEATMRETAGQMARTMQELPAQFMQQMGMASSSNTNDTTEEEEEDHDASSIRQRMYDAFRQAASGRSRNHRLMVLHEEEEEEDDDDNDVDDDGNDVMRTPNPYEHLPSQIRRQHNDIPQSDSDSTSSEGQFVKHDHDHSGNVPTDQVTISDESSQIKVPRKMPSGCVGAYFKAIRRASGSITRLIKEQRRARFEEQPDKEELARSFIDACCSDDGLSLVKSLVQEQGIIDAEGFYCGSDGTETCALHAAAFHGATQVLTFLCGGIDERDPSQDAGLCCVDLQDQNGWTALHFAAGANSVSSVRILTDRGANMSIAAENGYSALQWATRLSNHEVAAELKERLEQSDPYYNSNHPWISGASQPLSMIAHRFFAMIPAR